MGDKCASVAWGGGWRAQGGGPHSFSPRCRHVSLGLCAARLRQRHPYLLPSGIPFISSPSPPPSPAPPACRQLERQHSSSSASSSELRQLQGEVAARDAEVARLRKELEQLRKKLQGVQVRHYAGCVGGKRGTTCMPWHAMP